MSTLQPPRGTHDALPDLCRRFRFIEETALHTFQAYGYGEIRTPMFEFTDVFARNVGETTDIVTKEMYSFEDRGGESVTLRPEGTAPVVRAYYSNGLKQHLPLKLCYVGTPMFRYERPQKGRMRQHHQVGAEIFGIAGPMADVELISMGVRFLRNLGITDGFRVELNSLGTPEERQKFREALIAHLEPVADKLSKDSKERLHKNPMRILDTKDENDQELLADAPKLVDFLGADSKAHYQAVWDGLEALGIECRQNDMLVRGLDYYTHTVFEIHSKSLGAQSQVISGGRYDGLIEQMGGDAVPAVGFGSGLERLEMMLPEEIGTPVRPVHFVLMAEEAAVPALAMAEELRREGVHVHVPLELSSMKAQMKRANKMNARYAVVIGEDELSSGTFMLKDMETGEQKPLGQGDVVRAILNTTETHAA